VCERDSNRQPPWTTVSPTSNSPEKRERGRDREQQGDDRRNPPEKREGVRKTPTAPPLMKLTGKFINCRSLERPPQEKMARKKTDLNKKKIASRDLVASSILDKNKMYKNTPIYDALIRKRVVDISNFPK